MRKRKKIVDKEKKGRKNEEKLKNAIKDSGQTFQGCAEIKKAS